MIGGKKIDMTANARLTESIQNQDSNTHIHGDFEPIGKKGINERNQ
ncbi:MAG: hypothetical protein HDR22_10595 [Lachnospiraceae bacterium]|nr:hypothetical protein [Lachnospiraceae bacterium]